MNPLLDDDEDDLKRERELTLSTGMILGIFLVLVLLCGAFFGFGYKMGSHKATVPLVADATDGAAQPSSETFGGFKPSAGSPAGSNAAQTAAENPGGGDAPSGTPPTENPAPAPVARTTAPPVVTTPEPAVATGSFVVQVAAVSHEEDAQLLVTALKAKGYPVSAHTEAADKFYHISVGPFTNVKDAAAAKARLVADGYQPIIK
jgi:cell division septation protein DedD